MGDQHRTIDARVFLEQLDRLEREARERGNVVPARPSTAPPREPDEVLWASQRDAEYRIRLARRYHDGRPFLDLRVERRDRSGRWFPTPRGCAIRLSEVEGLAAALLGRSPGGQP
jgi:hypothetical protein